MIHHCNLNSWQADKEVNNFLPFCTNVTSSVTVLLFLNLDYIKWIGKFGINL